MFEIVDKLEENHDLSDDFFKSLLSTDKYDAYLFSEADNVRRKIYGTDVYIRGLIEFTNYCKNNCYYCGIRAGNTNAERYRLSEDDILLCCGEGYKLGYRTFVLQGGEDPYFSDEKICSIIKKIRAEFPDCAITLSIGEKSRESYQNYFDSGANRYLLRHETADKNHYRLLHPESLSLENRKRCLFDLKDIGFQTGSGFMVGSPYQTLDNIVSDLRFLRKLNPEMIGIGPFIPHKDTKFRDFPAGTVELTVRLIAILRLMFPYALIPATTALGTVSPLGREKGLKAGANVIMPNLSPTAVRKKYMLYDNKICTGEESAQCKNCLSNRVSGAGYKIVTDIGDAKKPNKV